MKAEEKKALVISTRAELGDVAQEVALKRLELENLQLEEKNEVTAVQARFEERIAGLKLAIAEKEAAARAWCLANREAFDESATMGFPLAELQFKAGGYSVQEKEGWDLKSILEALKKWARFGKAYLRVKVELDRRAILKDREKWKASEWAKRGLEIVQGHVMTITPTANAVTQARPGTA